MYSSPDRIGQLARDHHHGMLAAARQRQPRQPRPERSRPAPRIPALTRRLVTTLTKSTTPTPAR